MASISPNGFTVKRGNRRMVILYDHSRNHRARKFYLYPLDAGMGLQAVKDLGPGGMPHMPRKFAFALYLRYQSWLKNGQKN